MIVVILSNCPPALRGDLTRWLLEISSGVYVGRSVPEYASTCGSVLFLRYSLVGRLWSSLPTQSRA